MNEPPGQFRTVLVTGGAGFIGSALSRLLVGQGVRTIVLDKLTYAASPAALAGCEGADFRFVAGDIADAVLVRRLLAEEMPDAVVHLAAETHVDRSIAAPAPFVATNVVGTVQLLEAVLDHWRGLPAAARARFRFHHVSTDEVFGSLAGQGAFAEGSPYAPSSPYAASKAAADHFVRAWATTWGLPVLVSNCSNNYGPWQHEEKLIPRAIGCALRGEPIPLYGDGRQVRDWLHVDDHARALLAVLARGRVGQSYCIGARCERTNLEVAEAICDALGVPRAVAFVADRPGHDRRYAIDPIKVEAELGWRATVPFEEGLKATVAWYRARHRPD